ncbi:MAG: hypothetical protein HYX27_22130 [Acidobacteria bacterium]|nr:hypothetical protein [Acidobacteriota bacterium]
MPAIPIAAPATVGIAATGALVWLVSRIVRRSRNPQERERRRRIRLHIIGRLTEVTIFQSDDSAIQYGYEIAGVAYDTTQDISTLSQFLPRPAEQLVGTATAKYDPNNPANSIIVCEHWQGFKERKY